MDGGTATPAGAPTALREAPTCVVQWELERREGVHAYRLGPNAVVEILEDGVRRFAARGPMTVTVNRD